MSESKLFALDLLFKYRLHLLLPLFRLPPVVHFDVRSVNFSVKFGLHSGFQFILTHLSFSLFFHLKLMSVSPPFIEGTVSFHA